MESAYSKQAIAIEDAGFTFIGPYVHVFVIRGNTSMSFALTPNDEGKLQSANELHSIIIVEVSAEMDSHGVIFSYASLVWVLGISISRLVEYRT